MTLNYDRVWKTLNELESVTSKICSAREILDSAIDALENHKKDKAETLMYAVDEYLQYYLEEFDRKFKDAWTETVTKLNQEKADNFNSAMEALRYTDEEMEAMCDNAEKEALSSNYPLQCDELIIGNERRDYYENVAPSTEYKSAWNSFWEEDVIKEDKVVRWKLPVEKDTVNGEYFITFPDDLLEAANLSPGEEVEWVEQEVGTFLLRKIEKNLNHDDIIAAGWNMTADGFWVKE